MLNRAICAVIIFVSAYAYGVSFRNIEAITTQTNVSSVKLGRAEFTSAVFEYAPYKGRASRIAQYTVSELFELDFRWRLIQWCAAVLGAFGLVCLYSLLRFPHQSPRRQDHLANASTC